MNFNIGVQDNFQDRADNTGSTHYEPHSTMLKTSFICSCCFSCQCHIGVCTRTVIDSWSKALITVHSDQSDQALITLCQPTVNPAIDVGYPPEPPKLLLLATLNLIWDVHKVGNLSFSRPDGNV